MNNIETLLDIYANFSIIPVQYADKRPAFVLLPRVDGEPSWEPFQHKKAPPDMRRRWLSQRINIAVVAGRVSGNLVIIDFDDSAAYEEWRVKQDGLVAPTVKTASGYHVYVRYGPENVPHNTQIALASASDIKVGEIRGEGGYAVAPPSVHPSGVIYEWIVGPPSDDIPVIESMEQIGIVRYAKPSNNTRSAWQPGVPVYPDESLAEHLLSRSLRQAIVGSRNDTGLWLACQLRDNGFNQADAESVMLRYQSVAGRGDSPYTQQEAIATVRSAYKRPPRKAWRTAKNYPVQRREADFLGTFPSR